MMSVMSVLETYMPKDHTWQAWADCLHWAIGEPEILKAFREETGNNWQPGTTPIEMMIDEAIGADRAFIEAFLSWFNENIWGGAEP